MRARSFYQKEGNVASLFSTGMGFVGKEVENVGKSAGKFRDGHQKSINRQRDEGFVSGVDTKACL